MRTFRFLLPLIIFPLFLISCSKKEDVEFNPDLTKNAIYIDNNKFTLSKGSIAYVSGERPFNGYEFIIVLYSSGINSGDEGWDDFNGKGDIIGITILTDTWDSPNTGIYSTDFDDEDPGYVEIDCFINFDLETWESSHYYHFSSGTMTLQKEGSEYEFTILGKGTEYNENEVIINDGINIAVHYKGTLPEFDFLAKDPLECSFSTDTLDFTFGIDYDHPEKYLVPGEESDLSTENFEMVQDAIGTPSADIDGIMNVCHWINQNFTFINAGGTMAGVNTVDELFAIKTFYGCHSLALIISSVLREFGFPAVMIETVDVQWGYDYRSGSVEYFSGHVMSEIYVNNKWILLDNNCTYVEGYDYTNPYISVMNSSNGGLFVFAKGIDIWDYNDKSDSFTNEKMEYFSYYINCFEDLFYTVNYKWN